VLASLKSTGAINDLFKIEDSLSEQLGPVWASVAGQPLVEHMNPAGPPADNNPPADNSGVAATTPTTVPQPPYPYTTAPYPYDAVPQANAYAPYDYGAYAPGLSDYGYGPYAYAPYFTDDYYPYFYPGIFIGGFSDNGHRFGDRGFHFGPRPGTGVTGGTGVIGRLSNGTVLNNGGFGAGSRIVTPNFGFTTARFGTGFTAPAFGARGFAAPRAFGGPAFSGGGGGGGGRR